MSLPSPPGQDRPGQQRVRAKTSFSYKSNHSHKSSDSGKIDLHETHEEKAARRINTKADPSMAITEAEPAMVAAQEKSQLASIRAIQHRDSQGNPIVDPDRSNPTRSRWERPLDTIRSFEAAIDGKYRDSYIRTGSEATTNNRRNSYFGGNDERARYGGQNSYYGRQSYRPESTYMDAKSNGMTRPDSYYNTDNVGPSNGYYPNRARYPARTASEPHLSNGQGVYPSPGNQQSYETVTTASGSGSSADPAGYSTDPSSENSSVDRIAPLPVPPKEPTETYGFNGFGNSPQFVPPGVGLSGNVTNGDQQGYGDGPPPVPRKQVNQQSPIKPGSAGRSPTSPETQAQSPPAEKRKSWLGRRFSRS